MIFVTNFVEYSLEGYEVQAFRYLLKSDLDEKLERYVQQAVSVCRKERAMLRIRCEGQEVDIPPQALLYLEAALRCCVLHPQGFSCDTLSALLSSGEASAAAEYVDTLQRRQTERILIVNTHRTAIDAVLNQKTLYAQKRGIDMQFEGNDLSALRIREIDCTIVLANLLDNAIDACAKLKPPERWIGVKEANRMDALILIAAVVLTVETVAYETYSNAIGNFYKKWSDGHKEWLDANKERLADYVKWLGDYPQWFRDLCSRPVK